MDTWKSWNQVNCVYYIQLNRQVDYSIHPGFIVYSWINGTGLANLSRTHFCRGTVFRLKYPGGSNGQHLLHRNTEEGFAILPLRFVGQGLRGLPFSHMSEAKVLDMAICM